VDALEGMSARATASFVEGTGYARLANGETWTARLDDSHEHAEVGIGARLTVVGIDGATAVVAPATAPPSPATGATP
jgi:membrane protein implicated in regulation of membrane protease activity